MAVSVPGEAHREIGGEVLEGDLRYPSVTGNWATSTWASTLTATATDP